MLRRVDESASGTTFERWHPLTDAQFSVRAVLRDDAGVHERINYSPYGVAEHHWGSDVDNDRSADFFDWLAIGDQIALGSVGIGQANYVAEMDLNRDGTLDSNDANAIVSATALPSGWISGSGAGHPGNVIGFDGYMFNAEIETYSVRFRWYDPELGRWLQRDPSGYVDGQSLYMALHGSPSNYADPSGLDDYYWVDIPGRKDGVKGTYHHRYRKYRCGLLWLSVCTEYVDSRFTRDGEDVDDGGLSEYQRNACAALDSGASKAEKGLEVAQAVIITGVVINIPGPEDVVMGGALAFLRGGGRLIFNRKTGEWVHKAARGDGSLETGRTLSAQEAAAVEAARAQGLLKTQEELAEEAAEKACKPKSGPDYSDCGEEHTSGARQSTQQKHQEGQSRRQRDQGGEKGDKRRKKR